MNCPDWALWSILPPSLSPFTSDQSTNPATLPLSVTTSLPLLASLVQAVALHLKKCNSLPTDASQITLQLVTCQDRKSSRLVSLFKYPQGGLITYRIRVRLFILKTRIWRPIPHLSLQLHLLLSPALSLIHH